MAIRKKAATSDTTKTNVDVLAEHLKSIDKNVEGIKDDIKGVKDQFIALNGKVNSHASNLAVINSYDLQKNQEDFKAFKNRIMGAILLLGSGNALIILKLFTD